MTLTLQMLFALTFIAWWTAIVGPYICLPLLAIIGILSFVRGAK